MAKSSGPIRELSAGGGHSAGKVSLSDAIAFRSPEYALHPVILDGALQVFSASAQTVEDRKARMKLPVRFARILFLRSPGARASCVPECSTSTKNYRGANRIVRRSGPAVCAGGRFSSDQHGRRPARSGAAVRAIFSTMWSGRARPANAPPGKRCRLSRWNGCKRRRRDALEEVIAVRGRAELEAVDGCGG